MAGYTLKEVAPSAATPQKAYTLKEVAPETSRLESFGRGVLQGSTLSFGEEASAAVGAGLQKVFGGDPESYGQLYQRYRDTERAANKAADEAHGGYYLGGQLTGGVGSALVSGGAGLAAGVGLRGAVLGGAAYGGVAGLGESEADLTSGHPMAFGEAAEDVAGGVLLGGAAGGVGFGLGKLAKGAIRKLRPGHRAIEDATLGADKGVLAEGQALMQETGIPLNPAQLTKSPALLNIQETLKGLPGGQAILAKQRLGQIEKLHEGIKGLLEEGIGGSEATRRVATGYKALEKQVNAQIQNTARADFAAVDAAAGGRPTLHYNKFLSTIDDLIARETGSDAPTDETRRIIKALMRAKNDTLANTGNTGVTTASRFQSTLQDWGSKAASRGENVFMGVRPEKNKTIAKSLFGALREDLDAAAAASGEAGEAGQALLKARTNYAQMQASKKAMKDELLDSAVKAMSKNHPETFTTRLLQRGAGTSDQMISRTMSTVHTMDPEAATALRAAGLGKLLNAAAPKASSKLAQAGAAISPKTLVDLDQKLGSRVAALYAGDPGGLAAYRKFVEATKRLTLLGEKEPRRAWTSMLERMPFWKSTAIGAAAGATVGGPVGGLAGAAGAGALAAKVAQIGERLTAKRLAWILTDKEAMNYLYRVLNPKMGTTATQVQQAATALLYRLEQEKIAP